MAASATVTLLSGLTPPSLERTWLTAPHPTLPIVATCSSDKTVRVYSLTNFHLLSTITGGHKRSVRTCAWKPNIQGESVLATGSFDATVGIWRRWDNYNSADSPGLLLNSTQTSPRILEEDNSTPRGGGGDDGLAEGLGREDGEDEDEEWRFAVLLDGHDSEVKSVSWSPSGLLLATCARDKSIWIWEDLDDGDNNFETVAVMQEHEGDVKCVVWHPVEECLASASYDDTIRIWREDIDDWGQVACIRGHEGTVWGIDWEGVDSFPALLPGDDVGMDERKEQWKSWRALSGPRLVSCSHDQTVRIWKRRGGGGGGGVGAGAIPSIIRPTGTDETWEENSILPHAHDLSIYAVAWSKRTGLLASVGADGRLVIYEENFVPSAQAMDTDRSSSVPPVDIPPTEWKVIAVVNGAHGIYEINHVAWARRADRGKEEGNANEEVLITTGDDGSVKVWTFTR